MAQILNMLLWKTENKIVTVPIFQQNKHEEMTFICLKVEPEGEQKKAQRKRVTNCGRFCENLQKLSKGLQAGNACLLCLTLY